MGSLSKDLLVGSVGLLTSVLTALLLWWIDRQFGWSFYGLTFWVIVPVGAIVSGFVAASGYYFGARWLGIRPSWRLLVSMVAISVSCFFLIYYLSYATAVVSVQGQGSIKLSKLASFGEFLDHSLRSTQLSLGRAGRQKTSGELGAMGYALAALQVLGFSLGGFAVWAILRFTPYCESCARYLQKLSTTKRYSNSPEELEQRFAALQDLSPNRWLESLADFGAAGHKKGHDWLATIIERACRDCSFRQTEVEVSVRSGSDWKAQARLVEAWPPPDDASA